MPSALANDPARVVIDTTGDLRRHPHRIRWYRAVVDSHARVRRVPVVAKRTPNPKRMKSTASAPRHRAVDAATT
jgi:hypothetical protein